MVQSTFLFRGRQLILFFREAVCNHDFLVLYKEAKKPVWLRFKSENLVALVPELCFVLYAAYIAYGFYEL